MRVTAGAVDHLVGPLEEIPLGEGRAYHVAGRRIAVFRPRAGGVAATQAGCPHRAGPLADGIVGMGAVVCPLHNWRFSLMTGEAEVGDCGLEAYPCRVDDAGVVVVGLPAVRPEEVAA